MHIFVLCLIAYVVTIIGSWFIVLIDPRQRGGYISGTEIVWMFLLFFPGLNTLLFAFRFLYLLYGVTFGIRGFIDEWKSVIEFKKRDKEYLHILKVRKMRGL